MKVIYESDDEYVIDFINNEIKYEDIKYGEIKKLEILSEQEDVIMSMDLNEFVVNSNTIQKFQITDDEDVLRDIKFFNNKKVEFKNLKKV